MKNRALGIAAMWALFVACGESTPDFPIPTRFVLTWTCTGGCSIPFPYTDYEQMVLRDSGDGAFEASFFGESCSAVVTCQLETGPCTAVQSDSVEQLICSSLDACGVAGESLATLVICDDIESEMEAEPILVSDPESGDDARYDLHFQLFR